MYEKLDSCPLCKNTKFDNYMICDDHTVTEESFALVKCSKCQLIFTNPRPLESELSRYYNSEDYISHTNNGNSLLNILYKIVRLYTLKRKVNLLSKYSKKGSILDFGCGTGDFLNSCQNSGWQAFGFEPDNGARGVAQKKITNSIYTDLEQIKNKFDIISAWHVVEHISSLRETIKLLKKRLKDGGHLIIALPNNKSYDANHYQEKWAAYDVPRHLYHFDQESMKTFIIQFKLKLVNIIPMKFDSYYVSLLSEKYRKDGGLLRALKTGYQSNQKAKKTSEYSSLIYILKK
ncbi:class I SAM-dependent methyltransferase [Ekhidna sp.]